MHSNLPLTASSSNRAPTRRHLWALTIPWDHVGECRRIGVRQGVSIMRATIVAMVAVAGVALTPQPSIADEGGVSMWLPGLFGSLAAVPPKPGWSLGTIYFHTSVDAGGDVAAARQATIGRFNRNVNVDLNVALAARPDLVFISPNYTFATPVLGGVFTLSMAGAFGRTSADIDGTLTASVGNLVATRSGSISDERWGVADLFPQGTL